MKKMVLIIDDEKDITTLINVRLKMAGVESFVASNGMEGLDLLKNKNIDLIILDFMMPKMDGQQVLQELKKDNRLKTIPVIMLTGQERDSSMEEEWIEADAYISKPFEGQVLMDEVNRFIK
ncbi:MAG: response regulator [Candidatus Omnitrophica bacterium]|nr:response regulator [Candidatus Omnitrophota bacterium]